jgi:3-oxoacyl-[acyl-carrier protein] reductase
MTDLTGKVALVTGASQGIGAGIARVMAKYGADIAVNYLRSADLAQDLAEEIRALGRQAYLIQADVMDFQAVQDMVAKVEDKLGPIPVRNIMEIEENDWDWVLNLNLKAYYRCSKAVLPGMLARKEGRIINITSISGQRGGFSCDVDYSAAKAGINGFTRALARWAAPKGVLVNAVAPGYIETQMLGGEISPTLAMLLDSVPLKRQGTPEEIGEVVAFLAGPGATYIVGEVITVNGGVHIA